MTPNVKEAQPLPGYKLRLQFANDEIRDFDTAPFLDKGIFVELKDRDYLNLETIVGQQFCAQQ